MSRLTKPAVVFAVALTVCGFALLTSSVSVNAAKDSGADAYLKNPQTGDPGFKSIGRMSFGPAGILLVADPAGASIVAIDTGDTGPVKKLKHRVDDVGSKVASTMGAEPGTVLIVDMAVNPLSGLIYLSVQRQADRQFAILTVNADGEFGLLDLDDVPHVRVELPEGENSKVSNITGVAFANDRVLAAGQSREEFSSKIFSLPLPLEHGSSGSIYSAETYHVSHTKWETKAPIQSFVPVVEDGKTYVVGSFACTPIAKFPLDDVQSGAKVKGTSIVELGSGNRPLDMFTYRKDDKNWLVVNTDRFHWERKGGFGPSKLWGVRVDMKYLDAQNVNENAVRRDVKEKSGPEGIEIVDALFFAREVDKLNESEMVVLREKEGKLDLEVAPLP